MEIAENVHRVDDTSGSNCILLLDKNIAVVDTGNPGNAQTIVDYVKSIGRKPEEIKNIILTHFHHDHSGGAQELHNLTGASITAHKGEILKDNILRTGTEGGRPPFWYRWTFGLATALSVSRNSNHDSRRVVFEKTEVHQTVEDNEVLPYLGGLQILHTPGHTPGSICLYLAKHKILFLGDSVINNVNRLSRPLTWASSNRKLLDESLTSLRDIDAEIGICGHGPILEDNLMNKLRGMTDRPYNIPTWQIAIKNYQMIKKFRQTNNNKGEWKGSESR
ncbi:MAG: MBL fold metallo-hydrolase [SAR202 cluster bacterium]|nr:hypothetical protein [Chloroflexota bacterium]MQG84833.1 MBL fold metallo-hydrolase [SAR202 cluster bacterium]